MIAELDDCHSKQKYFELTFQKNDLKEPIFNFISSDKNRNKLQNILNNISKNNQKTEFEVMKEIQNYTELNE